MQIYFDKRFIVGGGLYWTTATDGKSKNACINGPATYAALSLYQLTKNETFLEIAKDLYSWTKKTLWVDGRVNDHIGINDDQTYPVDPTAFTCKIPLNRMHICVRVYVYIFI